VTTFAIYVKQRHSGERETALPALNPAQFAGGMQRAVTWIAQRCTAIRLGRRLLH
jgi:hypothetical protein